MGEEKSVTGSSMDRASMSKKDKKRKASSVIIHQDGSHSTTKSNITQDDDAYENQGNSERPSKKRRSEDPRAVDLDTSRPSALFTPIKARDWTVSLALPASFLTNFSKPDHKTMVAGRIARAAAVFCVDEVIIFDDDPETIPDYVAPQYKRGQGKTKAKKTKQEVLDSILEQDEAWQNPDQFLYHLLSFAECPPHLRYCKEDRNLSLFPHHENLKWAGMLPSMDMPHHIRGHEWCQYREGVVVGSAAPHRMLASSSASSVITKQRDSNGNRSNEQNHTSTSTTYASVLCGLPYPVSIPIPPSTEAPPPATRVTLRFAHREAPRSWPQLSEAECQSLGAEAVHQSAPREDAGYYWGYTVRRAASLSAVFQESEFEGGYDFSVGTSERGVPLLDILPGDQDDDDHEEEEEEEEEEEDESEKKQATKKLPRKFKHMLLCFGGVAGLEPAVANDPALKAAGLTKNTAHELFDYWVNLVPGQGSRTIRTEEAVEFGLMGLRGYVDSQYQ